MLVKEISLEQLDGITAQGSHATGRFLQSSFWQELQKSLGRVCLSLGVYDNDELMAGCLLIRYNFPMGKKYFNCIRGPVLRTEEPRTKYQGPNIKDQISRTKDQILNYNYKLQTTNYKLKYKEIVQKVAEYLYEKHGNENVLFLRIEPPVEVTDFKKWNKEIGVLAVDTVWPKKTIILDLAKNEEELLQDMHQKWRYNIRLAERKGVTIEKSNNIDDFYVLAQETERRDKIKFFGKEYFTKLLKVISKHNAGELLVAKYQNKVVSAIINVYHNDAAIYFYGSSSSEHRSVMPNHLIQWQGIKNAKAHGCKYYDFWGIAKDENDKSWAGITRFKRGFGGEEISYGASYDFIFNSFWYSVYKIMRKFYKL